MKQNKKYPDEKVLEGVRWFRCDRMTNATRKHYGFRRVGKILYCKPIKRKELENEID